MSKLELTKERYVLALERIRNLISNSKKLEAEDCTIPGMKSTECSWGLCSNEIVVWPDKEDMLFPEQYPQRVVPKYRKDTHKCPMDRRPLLKEDMNGCFYTCRVFNPKRNEVMNKVIALKLYDDRIIEARNVL